MLADDVQHDSDAESDSTIDFYADENDLNANDAVEANDAPINDAPEGLNDPSLIVPLAEAENRWATIKNDFSHIVQMHSQAADLMEVHKCIASMGTVFLDLLSCYSVQPFPQMQVHEFAKQLGQLLESWRMDWHRDVLACVENGEFRDYQDSLIGAISF